MHVLQNRAKALVEREGSGSNQNGFQGYADAFADMTVAGQASARQEQAELQKDHPATGDAYTISTRAVSSAVVQGKIGDASIVISVEVIRTENVGLAGVSPKASAKRLTMTFVRQADGTYLVDSVASTDVDL